MTKQQHSNHPSEPVINQACKQQGGLGALVRILWMLIGVVILIFFTFSIFQRKGPFFDLGRPDLLFWLTVGMLILLRFCDIKYLGGLTGQGQPASMAVWKLYAIVLVLIAAAMWVLAHAGAAIFK